MRRFDWYLGLRYFFSKKGNRYISWVSGISIAGIALGVVALILTLAILNGFEGEVTKRIIRFIPHLVISGELRESDLAGEQYPEIVERYQQLERKAILSTKFDQQVSLIQAIGNDQWTLRGSAEIHSMLGDGRLVISGDHDLPGIVIGAGLADKLMVSIGDTLMVTSPLDTRRGLARVPQRLFTITGMFRSNIFDYDRTRAFIHLQEGRRLFRQAGELQWHVRLTDYREADTFRSQLAEQAPHLKVRTWFEQHETLFNAMQLEKWGSFIGLNLIILVAVFNIVSTLIMLVLEKTGEIGILRVLGVTRKGIRSIFQIQGFLVAILGVLLGVFIGTMLVISQIQWRWIQLPTEIYVIPTLPMILSWWEIALVASVAFLIVILAVRYPAVKASKLVPVDAINYKK